MGILLLTSQDQVILELPANGNLYVRSFLEIYNPRFALARYAAELDVPIEQVSKKKIQS